MVAVSFQHVTKTFSRHGGQLLLRHRMRHLLRRTPRERFRALDDVSFVLHRGESVGIVGHNGAGKSTLLNLITRLCKPTSGEVSVEGRVAALLELGAGFHPDLTGEENVYINAALLGLHRKEAIQRFPEIVDFSEIGDFIREPLRTYSAGMVLRLAFSVAVHVDPEILVVDEVLGVGDQSFFEKSVDRIESFRRAGKTIISVSHSIDLLGSLCNRVLWMDHGRLMADGPPGKVLDRYREQKGRVVAVG
jgi:ABC-type polysaccharide/polyol phosphate transport system ATPase subunit